MYKGTRIPSNARFVAKIQIRMPNGIEVTVARFRTSPARRDRTDFVVWHQRRNGELVQRWEESYTGRRLARLDLDLAETVEMARVEGGQVETTGVPA